MVAVHNSTVDLECGEGDGQGHLLLVDFSRQRMTSETMNQLMNLATSKKIYDRIRDLAWGRLAPGSNHPHKYKHEFFTTSGGNPYAEDLGSIPTVSFAHDLKDRPFQRRYNNDSNNHDIVDDDDTLHEHDERGEMGGSMHLSLRAPAHKGLCMHDPSTETSSTTNGPLDSRHGTKSNEIPITRKNALDEIHQEWTKIKKLTSSLRQGKLRGASGRPLCDVLVVSAGGTIVPSALEFIYNALMHDETAGRAALLDSSLISIANLVDHGAEVNKTGKSSATKSGESMASSFQSGVINMVTTPFKSSRGKNAQESAGIATPSFLTTSNSSSSSTLRRRKLKFLSSIDPCSFKEALSDLSPATTMVITVSIDAEREKECKEATLAVKSWLVSGLSRINEAIHNDDVVRKHMFLVTGKMSMKRQNRSNVFLVPHHSRCESFSTFSSAGLLPLSLIFGWNVVNSLILGAHDIDRHFVESNPRHNIPLILSLTDVWNDGFLHAQGRIVSPFSGVFGIYPKFVAALEDKLLNGLGKSEKNENGAKKFGRHRFGTDKISSPSPVFDGMANEISLYRSSQRLSIEFITTLDPQLSSCASDSRNERIMSIDAILSNHDERMCAMFAHADTLAFGDSKGKSASISGDSGITSPGSPPAIQSVDSMQSAGSFAGTSTIGVDGNVTWGNRSSTIILCGTCDAFTCGQLIALAEHRAMVKAWLWDLDPFVIPKKQSTINERSEYLKAHLNDMRHILSLGQDLDEVEDGSTAKQNINFATKTILTHYAKRIQKYKAHSQSSPMRASRNRFTDEAYF